MAAVGWGLFDCLELRLGLPSCPLAFQAGVSGYPLHALGPLGDRGALEGPRKPAGWNQASSSL